MKDVTDVLRRVGKNMGEQAASMMEDEAARNAAALQEAIKKRMGTLINRVSSVEGKTFEKFAGINEAEVLRYVPDKRSLDGLSTIILALFFLVILPGALKFLAGIFLFFGGAYFCLRYIGNAKVDVPDGYQGVVCLKGRPLSFTEDKAHAGRNWLWDIRRFIPYLVSTKDQIVESQTASYTTDYLSIAIMGQFVLRVVDPDKFISTTTPALIMKIISLYASYLSTRLITSLKDARVKFTDTQALPNFAQAMNTYLAGRYGINIIRANVPRVDNDVIDDLEEVRTLLQRVEALEESEKARLESAIKQVETQVRRKRKETRSEALNLQQAAIRLETDISDELNRIRQAFLIEARSKMEGALSELHKTLANLRANIEKAKNLRMSLPALMVERNLRLAALRRKAFRLLVPKQVSILGVEGMGIGMGMVMGNPLLARAVKDVSKQGTDQQPSSVSYPAAAVKEMNED